MRRTRGIVLAVVAVSILAGCQGAKSKPSQPKGKVTQKMWVDDYWVAGEQLYPQRWCLELNYRDEVCIPEKSWKTFKIGDWFGAKK